MKILVIGSGGREHALVWKLHVDNPKDKIFCAPGNAGTSGIAENLKTGAEDVVGLLDWAKENKPDLTIVGPEVPLCMGIVDAFRVAGLRIFGPEQAAARMEGSKAFSKDVMIKGGVPTAKAGSFTDLAKALKYLKTLDTGAVVKADGLAAGKGVFVCPTVAEAEAALKTIMSDKTFGKAGETVVVEELLPGEEASILALVDGKNIVMLASAQDHKRIFDGDAGPNTGGMGAYSPAPVVTNALWSVIREQVFEKTLAELRKRGIAYKGVLYAGLMIHGGAIKVLEFNCRFGDPETQAILPRLKSPLVPALEACIDGTLDDKLVTWKPEACICVVMAAGGYPGEYRKGNAISGLDQAATMKDAVVFHAGTRLDRGNVVTAGGRVLGVTALGGDIKGAISKAYKAVSVIKFDGAHYRKDIAARALAR